MTKEMNITEARKALMEMPEEFDGNTALDAIEVTRRGETVLYIVSPEEYRSLAETREIVADKATLKGIANGLKDAEEGKLHTAAEVRKKLNL